MGKIDWNLIGSPPKKPPKNFRGGVFVNARLNWLLRTFRDDSKIVRINKN